VKIVPKQKKTLNFIFKSDKQTYFKKLSDEQTYEKKLKCQNPDGRFSLNKRKEEPANTGLKILNFCWYCWSELCYKTEVERFLEHVHLYMVL
jgi:hypothetical protein